MIEIDKPVAVLILIIVFGPVLYSLFKEEKEKKKIRDRFFSTGRGVRKQKAR